MAQLTIVTIDPRYLDLGECVLRRRAAPIDVSDPAALELARDLAQDMFAALYAAGGSGLAAPQVGVLLRLVVADARDEPFGPHVFLNPEIVVAGATMAAEIEGCLSLPGFQGEVDRHTSISVRAWNLWGDEERLELTGGPARLMQHEIDHLDGILYPDRFREGQRIEPSVTAVQRRARIAMAKIELVQRLANAEQRA